MTDRKRDPLPEGYQFGDAAMKPEPREPSEYRRLYDAAKAAEPRLGATINVRLPRQYVHVGGLFNPSRESHDVMKRVMSEPIGSDMTGGRR